MGLINNINDLFKDMSYFTMYNFDIWITILVVIIIIIITIFFFIKNKIESNKINWEENKCNPLFMAFGSFINKGVSDDFNVNNFKECTNNLLFGISIDLKNPLSTIFSIFGGIFKLVSSLMSSIMGFFLYLFNMIMNLFRQLILIISKIISGLSTIFQTISNFVGSVLGFFTLIFYQISLFVDSWKYIFPIMVIIFMLSIIIPTITFTIFSIAMLILGYILSHFFCIGCPIVALFSIVVPICFIFLAILYFILRILLNFALFFISKSETAGKLNITPLPMKIPTLSSAKNYN